MPAPTDRITVRGALPGLLVSPPRRFTGPAGALRARRIARELSPHHPPALHRPSIGYSDVLVLRWEGGDGADGRVLAVKHPRTPRAAAALAREREVLRALAGDERLADWRRLLPATAGSRLDAPLPVLLQEWLPGTPADVLLGRRPQDAAAVTRAALAAVAELHRATGRTVTAEERRVRSWAGPRLAVLAGRLSWCRSGPGAEALLAVERRLCEGLAGRRTRIGWTHGDFAPDNVLLDNVPLDNVLPNGAECTVTGLVDWADAGPDRPCEIDPCTFALGLGWLLERRGWGEQVVAALRGGGLRGGAPGGVPGGGVPGDVVHPPAIVLLTWLWHVSANLEKSRAFARNRDWLRSVVVPVLEAARETTRESLSPAAPPRSTG